MSDKIKFNLNTHVHRLLVSEPFFASLSRRIEKKESSAVPTAGVRVNPETASFELVWNPEFFEGLTESQRTGVLIHEFYHLVMEHILTRLPDELEGAMSNPTQKQASLFQLFNIAADLSINPLIGRDRLPKNCCFPGEGMFANFPMNDTMENYYERLKKEVEKQKNKSEGGDSESEEGGEGSGGFDLDAASEGQFDDHSEWGKGASDTVKEIAKQRLAQTVKEATEETINKGNDWGTVSASMRKEIIERITPKVDWRKVLRYFVKTSQRAEKRSTVRRINKRYPYIHPGKKVRRQASIAVSIDQSGSVDDSMLAAFFAELNKLADIASFTVIPFDSEVAKDKIYTWKKGETRKWERVMYGGTDFNPPTEYVNKNNFDGHIVLTDLCAPKPVRSKCQRMWMTTSYYAERPYFQTNERIIAIDN